MDAADHRDTAPMNTPRRDLADDYYRALEDRFRGSRAAIKARLAVYLPALQPVAARHPARAVFDVGCGRGEWLELLAEQGIPAHGMDLDAGMLAAGHEQGLAVSQGDAIAWLQQQPAASLLAITAFHVVEHLELAQLCTLLEEARRVLIDDGLLILETPNPENLVVGTASFYIDPTHRRPLPQQLLSFLAEHAGFASVELYRLQEEQRLHGAAPPMLYDVLGRVSPDYAIVARCRPDPGAGPAAEGVALYDLAMRYDAALEQRFLNLQQAWQAAQAAAVTREQQWQHELAVLDAEQASLRRQMAAAQTAIEAAAAMSTEARRAAVAAEDAAAAASRAAEHAQLRVDQSQAQLQAILASHSWRITAPLRWLRRHLFRK